MPGAATDAPFAKKEPSEDDLKAAFYGKHDLRETFTRENTERRRAGGHTLRRLLTAAQDKALTAKFVKLRSEYAIESNSDAVIVFAQEVIASGKETELNAELAKLAKATHIPKRTRPWDDEKDH